LKVVGVFVRFRAPLHLGVANSFASSPSWNLLIFSDSSKQWRARSEVSLL
jgi:hypothetical protein